MWIEKGAKPGSTRLTILCCTVLLLTGCTSYQAHPLPKESMSAKKLIDLQYSVKKQHEAGLHKRVVNTADGLDLTEVAIIAVLNNPDLQAERAKQSLAGAQLFAAGLLPDPHISASLTLPTGNTNGAVNAWGLGLGYDIIPLITRQARIDSRRQAQIQVNLHLLWQEWQVMLQAKTLTVRYTLELKKIELLQKAEKLCRHRYESSSVALRSGDITLDGNNRDLTALLTMSNRLNQVEQIHNQTRHQTTMLLGLAPDVELHCILSPQSDLLSRATAGKDLHSLQKRRPDLLALQAGYQSQEAEVRAAVLGQFPSLSIGMTRGKDTDALSTTGFGVNLNLPLFSGSRGAIAIKRATREQLRLEYQARLSHAFSDVDKLFELQKIITAQQTRLKKYLPKLRSIVEKTKQAYTDSDVDAQSFFNMEYTWILKQLEEITLEQSQWETSLALQAMLALPEDNGLPSGNSSDNHIISRKHS